MCNYDPMPSVSPLRHLPSLPIIHTPLGIRCSDTIIPTGRRPTENDNDITPRPLLIKKVKNPPQCPSVKNVEADKKGEKDTGSMRGDLE